MVIEAADDAERVRLVERAAALARERFERDGFNCAESVLYGVAHALDLPAPDAVLRAATPFGGGMGLAGCTCGALSGAMIALGLALGRTAPDQEQKKRAYAHARHLWRRFVERSGGEDCRELNTLGFKHPEHKAYCARFVVAAAELAAEELLQDGGAGD